MRITLTQTVAVEELRSYVVGFWRSIGRTSGSDGAGRDEYVVIDGQGIAMNETFNSDVGQNPSDHVHRSAVYTTSAGQTSATITFDLSGSGTGQVGFSYDDFHFDGIPCGNGVVDGGE